MWMELKAWLSKCTLLGWARLFRSGEWWVGVAGWGRKAENKAKAQYSTDITPSKLLAELQHSAWLGKTFPGGWLGGLGKAGNKLGLSCAKLRKA